MKKRLIISIIILLLSFSACVTSYTLIANELGKLRSALYDALYTFEETGDMSGAQSVEVIWEEIRGTVGLFLDGTDLRQIDEKISSVCVYAATEDKALYPEKCVECACYIEAVCRLAQPRKENVL